MPATAQTEVSHMLRSLLHLDPFSSAELSHMSALLGSASVSASSASCACIHVLRLLCADRDMQREAGTTSEHDDLEEHRRPSHSHVHELPGEDLHRRDVDEFATTLVHLIKMQDKQMPGIKAKVIAKLMDE